MLSALNSILILRAVSQDWPARHVPTPTTCPTFFSSGDKGRPVVLATLPDALQLQFVSSAWLTTATATDPYFVISANL